MDKKQAAEDATEEEKAKYAEQSKNSTAMQMLINYQLDNQIKQYQALAKEAEAAIERIKEMQKLGLEIDVNAASGHESLHFDDEKKTELFAEVDSDFGDQQLTKWEQTQKWTVHLQQIHHYRIHQR